MPSNKMRRSRRTTIVPRVVFQTVVAIGVIPAAAVLAGCSASTTRTDDAGFLGVAALIDAGRDGGTRDVGPAASDTGTFSVALIQDAAFSVTANQDGGAFSVAADFDGGFFGVGAPAPDAG